MKYPLIVTPDSDSAIKVIVFNKSTDSNNAIHIGGRHKGEVVKYFTDGGVRDITREYLSNTWGVVESKEHAEFIIELAELHGFEVSGYTPLVDTHFYITDSFLGFVMTARAANSSKEKQITIPLPPKAKAEKPDFSKPPKHLDCLCNKCGGKCCAGFCDEWPQVGDEVVTSIGEGVVKLLGDKLGHYLVDIGGVYNTFKVEALKKPKTPEEEVEHNLIDLIMRARDADADDVTIARSILSKYNITKKDKGDE